MPTNGKILLIICAFLAYSHCYSFNTKGVAPIRNVHDGYFGYSLLLQKGVTPAVIVGAPKDVIINGTHYGGQASQCDVEPNGYCTPLVTSKTTFKLFHNQNGDFFGGALDGDDDVDGALVICSPRSSVIAAKPSKNSSGIIYTPGACYFRKERNETFSIANVSDFKNFQYEGLELRNGKFFDYGYSLFGFDISFYNMDNVLFGAPGLRILNGAIISFSLSSFNQVGKKDVTVMPNRKFPIWSKKDSYFGYSIDSGLFHQFNNHVCFIAGEPRGNDLKGKAGLYHHDENTRQLMIELWSFQGGEFGSYFGASVLVLDVTNDIIVDALIGAPTSVGNTYDEGCVYFYKGSEATFMESAKLTGSNKTGGRFGTAMSSLGDYDLDGYNDVAISAPYENNGEGAVYIYRGSAEGLRNSHSQKLSPLEFGQGLQAKGFGLGISRGNDIDQNGHNDFAIGAYKAGQVFVVKSRSIIDYEATATNRVKDLYKNTTNLYVTICVNYTKRSEVLHLPEVEFDITMLLDYRLSLEDLISRPIRATLNIPRCRTYNINISQNEKDVSPIEIGIKLSPRSDNISANGNKTLKLTIPYLLGCLTPICNTGLTVNLTSSRDKIYLDGHKLLKLDVLVLNDGEPALSCKLSMTVPVGIQLENSKDCIKNSDKYTCPVADILGTGDMKLKTFIFVVDPSIHPGDVEMLVSLTSNGVNKNGYKNKDIVKVSLISISTMQIMGNSMPKLMELKEGKNINVKEVTYTFSISKQGPSPVELRVDILLPQVIYNGQQIFQIDSIQGITDKFIPVHCNQTDQRDVNWNAILSHIDDARVKSNRAIMVHCKDFDCLPFSCYGDYLNTSSQTAVLEVKITVNSYYLVPRFKTELRTKDLIAYIPVVIQKNLHKMGDGEVEPRPLLIFVEDSKSIPLWAYLVAALGGAVLFITMLVGLKKCRFFDRTYRKMLEEQQIWMEMERDNDTENSYSPNPMPQFEDDYEDMSEVTYQNQL